MQYAFLIYSSEENEPTPGSDEHNSMMQGYFGFTEEVKNKGIFGAGEPLESVSTATTVRVNDGKTIAMDGPFAETKEQLGGFYVLECKDLEEAIVYAAKIPGANYGCVEIRPIPKFE